MSAPSIRFANLGQLAHPLSVDLYLEKTAAGAKLVVVRAMGGAGYWPYGLDRLRALSRAGGPALIAVPGEDRWDTGLESYSLAAARGLPDCSGATSSKAAAENARRALAFSTTSIGRGARPEPPLILPHAGCYAPGRGAVSPGRGPRRASPPARPWRSIVFYRALIHGGSTEPIDALVAPRFRMTALRRCPVFVTSLKDRESEALVDRTFWRGRRRRSFSTRPRSPSRRSATRSRMACSTGAGVPVLQVVLAGSSVEAWRESARGLLPRDLTMNVVLPEVDGRILTRAISFKEGAGGAAVYRAEPGRVRFVAAQAAAWARLAADAGGGAAGGADPLQLS